MITGATSGIGLATLKRLVADGHIVYGSARKKEDLTVIENAGGKPVTMEMTDYTTLEQSVNRIIKENARIDVLFNNAGYGLYGSVEEVPIEAAKHEFDVNLFGLARLTQLVLPHMRKAKTGTIINMFSMGGHVYFPLGSWYHASKHAVEGWSDSLRLEVKQFGIKVVIIEPGAIATSFGDVMEGSMMKYSGKGPYRNTARSMAESTKGLYGNPESITPPSAVANVISRAISSPRPKTRYVVGKYARPLMFIRKYLGDRVYDKVAMRRVN